MRALLTTLMALLVIAPIVANASACDTLRWDITSYQNAHPFTLGPVRPTNQCGEDFFQTGVMFDGDFSHTDTDSATGLRGHIEFANPTRGQDDGVFSACDNGTPQECGFPLPSTYTVGDNSGLTSPETVWIHTHQPLIDNIGKLFSPLGLIDRSPFMGNSSNNGVFNYGSLNCKKPEDPVYEVTITSMSIPTGSGGEPFGNRWIGSTTMLLEGVGITPVRTHRQLTMHVVYGPENSATPGTFGKNLSGESNPGQLNITVVYVDDAGTLTGERFIFEPPEIYSDADICQTFPYNVGIGSEGYLTGDSRRIAGVLIDARPDRVAYATKKVYGYPDADSDGVANPWDADFDQDGSETLGTLWPNVTGDYFKHFVPCWNSGPSIAAGCEAMDVDADGDIDNADEAIVKHRVLYIGTPGF